MTLALAGSAPEPIAPRVVVVRNAADVRLALQMAAADVTVVLVVRVEGSERTRVDALVEGWALGAGVRLDGIGPNTTVLHARSTPPARLARSRVDASVGWALAGGGPLDRAEEERLVPLARAGSQGARRRLVDAHAELATTLALWMRPPHVSAASAVRRAHHELDIAVATPSDQPLLVALVAAIHRPRP